jgi:hypothetical protein
MMRVHQFDSLGQRRRGIQEEEEGRIWKNFNVGWCEEEEEEDKLCIDSNKQVRECKVYERKFLMDLVPTSLDEHTLFIP